MELNTFQVTVNQGEVIVYPGTKQEASNSAALTVALQLLPFICLQRSLQHLKTPSGLKSSPLKKKKKTPTISRYAICIYNRALSFFRDQFITHKVLKVQLCGCLRFSLIFNLIQ